MTLIQPNRRSFLKSAVSVAATAAAARLALPGGAWAATATPEVTGCTLGYIALTDSAPLIIALEKGLFAKHGMPDVKVEKQASWGATRDNMALGAASGGIDGGHILRPKVHLYSTGKVMQNNQPLPMYTLLNLNEDAQGISVSQAYADTGVGVDSSPLREVFAAKRAAGQEIPVAMTFPGGTHDLWMRYWLAAGGIDPTKDVDLIVVPPPQMVANMKVGNMEAFCVGEPWNEQLVNQGIGFTATTTGEIWSKHPEKVLGMRAQWVDDNPNATLALMMAVMEAQIWCDDAANKDEMAEIIGRRQWYNVPVADIVTRLKGQINFGNGRVESRPDLAMKFWGADGATSYPWKSLDTWFVTENKRWGAFAGDLDTRALVDATNRSDLWLAAAKGLGLEPGFADSRGVETFFDGKIFDPANPEAYLDSQSIKAMV
ncbi:MAG: CmpA/NrtA family ABC transporter substrate-binding protein [Pseudotabrizicola sp.]|uniref:CmpA/NrtA family ABC transporter substrate-binding protein n=1 Tax=Pseudotabrizicola sp. TaxID=2939647 RepID=UPI0027269DCF|nr:CmpA/NrtA family ABC transporter substrate-binding protein [Pseudotabrizicola sp.]MDO8884480.1 CmpA/NrtA family ABC transporter substrate-binding protein [Pseudotabrizicola sp.]MDP2081337.1 CmpA/NrtA family ABC transporter substrate-binding protein [Pseudotabrizicola sp.]MDZ7576044.1 CmpA/NrtA family ABC transporter substrate-binding protein [Pseudotabrizicola sp.]